MASDIELVEVTKRYPGVPAPAVESVSLTIPAGETVVFVGPSGCGKTTTMRMINRLIEPTSGLITIDGRDTASLDPDELRRGIGYAIQQAGLFPHMTVAQNVGAVPGLLGWGRARTAERVDEMLDLVGLDPADFRDRYPRQLSGGQQQRVGVARALAADPPVLLMDEPFGAVDPITRGNLQDELMRLQGELRKTIVFVTHDFDEAVKLGDRIAVLGPRSRVLQYDTPEAILANPADDTVAGFVGAGASLKQLRLRRVREIELGRAVTASVHDEPAEIGRRLTEVDREYGLLLDARNRPVSWVRAADPRHPRPVGDSVTLQSTLQDALEAILTEGGMAVVTGPRGEYVGVVEMDAVIGTVQKLRDDHAEVGA
ncbi:MULTISPECIES: ABC transporter ATP-binding protein [Saccharothrix]|uniref:ABC transporter ATP-binding protein n=1 Tax=Saccharothrix TaxID=2071 RepID=UPI00093DE150|nr:ATP-binding cassette domain-containing protein [Saccharothrix sp. CB00851]OKI31998.1 ABC transporter [Saccharothrix sp. CB00851]